MPSTQQPQDPVSVPALNELTITVVHDNYPYADSLKAAWGFSAVVTGAERTILFDTGSDGRILLENMARLHIEPAGVDIVVLSHKHGDHTGGLTDFLKANAHVDVYLPKSFPARVKDIVREYGATVVDVAGPRAICANVSTTGVMGRRIREQALILRTQRGLIVLSGCAHPGIARMVEKARDQYREDFLLVIGGFHLEWATAGRVGKVIAGFKKYNVQYVAPTHCSGERARHLFRQQYGQDYIEVGVGKVTSLADLR